MAKKIIGLILFMCFMFSQTTFAASQDFLDVPKDHWAYNEIMKMKELGITKGIDENNFGATKSLTRAEFATFLVNLMKWEVVKTQTPTFSDNQDAKQWYYAFVETAAKNGATDVLSGNFRPYDNITREEMAQMIVKSLGYSKLAAQISYLPSAFGDVSENIPYINIAKNFGIISGVGDGKFNPKGTANREQAAAMLMRMYTKTNNKITFLNGFYAIKSAAQQSLIPEFDAISFGWSRLELNNGTLILNTTKAGGNEYSFPSGYEKPLGASKQGYLMVTVVDEQLDTGNSLTAEIIANPDKTSKAISEIVAQLDQFDGVVIDFESLKGTQSAQNLNNFLTLLKPQLNGKTLAVAVHPQRRDGQTYFDGYNYKQIGEIADKVILMAHDYNARKLTAQEMATGVTMTPLAPIEEVFYALSAITNEKTGVSDKNKIVLQISFDTAQWKTLDGVVINEKPFRPDYETLTNRINKGVNKLYEKKYESPYVTFDNTDDGTNNIVWYENAESVAAKIKLAKMFSVNGLSVWRLGNMPDDAWQAIKGR